MLSGAVPAVLAQPSHAQSVPAFNSNNFSNPVSDVSSFDGGFMCNWTPVVGIETGSNSGSSTQNDSGSRDASERQSNSMSTEESSSSQGGGSFLGIGGSGGRTSSEASEASSASHITDIYNWANGSTDSWENEFSRPTVVGEAINCDSSNQATASVRNQYIVATAGMYNNHVTQQAETERTHITAEADITMNRDTQATFQMGIALLHKALLPAREPC